MTLLTKWGTGHADNTYRPDRNITRALTTRMTGPITTTAWHLRTDQTFRQSGS